MKNTDKKAIIINLISSTLFQIILFIISGSGIVLVLRKLINSLKNNTVNISIFTLIILIISCIIITICVIALTIKTYRYIKNKKNSNNSNDYYDNNADNNTDNYYNNNTDDYYFDSYEKHITIYKNGNGIIVHKFTVIINDINKFKRIRRKLNISDAHINSNFPTIEEMMNTKKSERFDKFGFWYYDDDNIISKVKEYYWQKNSSGENEKIKNDPKEIRWIFKINNQHIRKNVPYDIIYAISVPGLSALENGKLNPRFLSDENDKSSSNMNIDHKIKKLKYIISFEKEIEIESLPKCTYVITGQDGHNEEQIDGLKESDIWYDKYIFNIDAPKFNSDIKVEWKYNKINTI